MKPDLPTRTRTAGLLLALLSALTLALFWPASGYDFVKLDDDQYICLNPHVLTGLAPDNLRWAFTTIYQNWWLPLLWISYMADTQWFGPEPFGYHLTNILLHTVTAALLFWFLFRSTGSRWRSLFAAACFAIHPLRVESVAWISERKDVLSGLFFCLALLAQVRQAERPSAIRLGLVHLWMLLGLMSKSILVILPPLLLLLDYWPLARAGDPGRRTTWPRWRRLLLEKSGLFVLALVFIALNLHTHHSTLVNRDGTTWLQRLGLIFPNYWDYLAKIAWPAKLSVIYPPRDLVNWPLSLVAVTALVAVTLLLLRHRQKCPYAPVGWLWFLVALGPVIRGIRFDDMLAYADRYTYLPSIGLGIALVWGAGDLISLRPKLKTPVIAAGLALLAAWGIRSRLQLPYWKESFTTFSELIDFAPDHFAANSAYGFALLEKGRVEEALVYFARAAEIKPKNTQAPADYADALLRLGRNDEAIAWLQQALAERDPNCPVLNSLLAFAWLDVGRADLAILPLRKALAHQPRNLGWRIELIRALFETGDEPAAFEEIRSLQGEGYVGIRGFDDLIPHYVNWWSSGEKRHAWNFFQSALRTRPDHLGLLNTAAWLLATDSAPPAPPEEAVRLARRAVNLAPAPHPGLLDTLAAALAATGDIERAQQTARQALALARQGQDPALVARIQARLAVYRAGQPWRE